MNHEDALEVISKIVKINVTLSDEETLKKLTGDALSYIGMKLAVMKALLIEVKVEAHRNMLTKEVAKDKAKAVAYAKAKKEHGSTAASDIKYSDEDFIKAQNEFAEGKINFERLRSIVADTHDTIDAIKTRVIDLQGSRKDERLG